MPTFMYQATYNAESWSNQIKNPQNRVETVGRQMCESVGGKFIGAWLCFGDYDVVLIAELPDNESMAALSLTIAAGGAIKSSKTTPLITGAEGIQALKKAATAVKVYKDIDTKRTMAAPGR